jgi:hypothetical protein
MSLITAFAQHAEMFDSCAFVVHNAVDGTFEFLKENFPESTTFSNLAGHPQSTVMTKLMIEAFELGIDVVIPLDADEFLPFSSRSQLDAFLVENRDIDVLQIPWRNFSARTFPLLPDLSNLIYAHKYSSVHKSIIYKSAYMKDPKLKITQGNHDIQSKKKMIVRREKKSFIIHIPIRDPLQYAQKNIHGASTYLEEKTHDLSDDWIKGALEPFPVDSELIEMALDYGDKKCQVGHTDLKSIDLLPWMTNGYSQISQSQSFLKVMHDDWKKLRLIYGNTGDGETTKIELVMIKHRIMKYEQLFFFRLMRRMEREFTKSLFRLRKLFK